MAICSPRQGRIIPGVLQDDRPVIGIGHAPEHLHRHTRIGSRGRHGDDRVGPGLLRRAGEEKHLRNRHAGAAENDRQPPVDLFQHRVKVLDALRLAKKVKLTDHDRPYDAVLAAPAAEIGCRTQIGGADGIVLVVRGGEQPKHAL